MFIIGSGNNIKHLDKTSKMCYNSTCLNRKGFSEAGYYVTADTTMSAKAIRTAGSNAENRFGGWQHMLPY